MRILLLFLLFSFAILASSQNSFKIDSKKSANNPIIKDFDKKLSAHLRTDSIGFYLNELKSYIKVNNFDLGNYLYFEYKAKSFSALNSRTKNNLDSLVYYYSQCINHKSKYGLPIYDQLYQVSYEHIIYCETAGIKKHNENLWENYLTTKNEKVKSRFYSIKATMFSYCLNQYDSAITYYIKSLEYFKSNKDSAQIPVMLENIGMAYLELNNKKMALIYLNDALKYELSIKSKVGEFFCKNQIAKAIYDQDFYLAERYLKESYSYFKQTNEVIKQTESSSILAALYYSTGKLEEAEKYIDESIYYLIEQNNKPAYLDALITKSNILYKKKEYRSCLNKLITAIEINEKTKLKLQGTQIYELKHQCENKLGLYDEAYKSILKYNSFVDSLKSEEQSINLKKIEEKFESVKKEEELKLLKAQNEIDAQKQKQKSNLLIAGIIITTLFGVFFFFLLRNRQKINSRLKEIDVIKTQFFENISHEFRTPLTLIKLPLSQAIKNNKELGITELNLMHNNASRLQNLIEDLLSLSELEAGKMKINKSEQDPLVQVKTLCSQFDSYAESKGISYHKVIERNAFNAVYDKSVLDKVLSNLISNAIKYSENGGEVQVSVALVSNDLVVKVSDKGEGISPEHQEKIFKRFYRVGETDEGKQGSGIGLALVKKLLEINNGSIEVTSKINEGSTFTATLPLESIVKLPFIPEPEKESIQAKWNKATDDLIENVDVSNKPKLLIVEDNKELLEYIANLFKKDFQIVSALNGAEGMEKALEFVPDFIISDWMMPKMNGIEFCKAAKTNTVTSHIPFLLLTAKSMVEDKIEGYETGADAYFSKPFNFDELKSRIQGLIKQRELLYRKFNNNEIQPSIVSTSSMDIKFWDSFKAYLTNNISDSQLNANQFADHLAMSRMQLHRKLTSLTGQNLSSLISNQRMNLASNLLKDPANRISDVCFDVGYEDQSSFARAFKKEFGVSPTQYRANLK